MKTLDGLDSTSVKAELAIWREKYTDVSFVFDEFVTLRGRTVMLRDEVGGLSYNERSFKSYNSINHHVF